MAVSNVYGGIDVGDGVTSLPSGAVVIARYDGAGGLLWKVALVGSDSSTVVGRVDVDAQDNVYVGGTFSTTMLTIGSDTLTKQGSSDIFLAKFASSGQFVWSRRYTATGFDGVCDLAVTPAGTIVWGGVFLDDLDVGGGSVGFVRDILVASHDTDGNHRWSRKVGGSQSWLECLNGGGMGVDGSGNAYLSGAFQGNATFGGQNFVDPNPEAAGRVDDPMFFAKLVASNGNHAWSRTFGSDAIDQSEAWFSAALTGQSCGTARVKETVDFGGGPLSLDGGNGIVIGFDTNGGHVFSTRFEAEPTSIAMNGEAECIVSGGFSGTPSFGGPVIPTQGGDDVFVAKYDRDGAHLWSKGFGDANAQSASQIAAASDGGVVVAGRNSAGSSIDFGGGVVAGAIFVVKLSR